MIHFESMAEAFLNCKGFYGFFPHLQIWFSCILNCVSIQWYVVNVFLKQIDCLYVHMGFQINSQQLFDQLWFWKQFWNCCFDFIQLLANFLHLYTIRDGQFNWKRSNQYEDLMWTGHYKWFLSNHDSCGDVAVHISANPGVTFWLKFFMWLYLCNY